MNKIFYTIVTIILAASGYLCYSFNNDHGQLTQGQDVIDYYNQKIVAGYKNRECWVNSPLLISIELTGGGAMFSKEKEISCSMLNTGEVAKKVKVVIQDNGIMEDELTQRKVHLILEKNDSIGVVTSAYKD